MLVYRKVVGMAKNNEATNYNDAGFFRSAIYFLTQNTAKHHNSGMKTTAPYTLVFG